jgi:hypothetical protein
VVTLTDSYENVETHSSNIDSRASVNSKVENI